MSATEEGKADGAHHQHAQQIANMTKMFLEMAEMSQDAENPWTLVASLTNPTVDVFKLQNTDFCIKVLADLNCTPETAFDMLSDITKRGEWDDLCEESGVIEIIDSATKIQFLKTKGIWPASARDTLVLAHVERLPDGRYLNVAQSVEHPQFPPRETESIVRMEAKISGQIVGPTPDNQPGKCRVIQVADGDLKGWIPKSVIGFVATKSIPSSFKRLDGILKGMEQKTVSNVIALAEGKAELATTPNAAQPQQGAITVPPIVQAVPSVVARREIPKAAPTLLGRIRALLDWWSPWMITFLFAMKIFRLLKPRQRGVEYI